MLGNNRFYISILWFFILCVIAFTAFNYYFFEREIQDAIYTTTVTESEKKLNFLVDSAIAMAKVEEKLFESMAKREIKREVDNAWHVANTIYLFCKEKRCSKKATELLIKRALSKIRFFSGKGNGYIFIDSVKGNVILSPGYSKIEGKNVWNEKNPTGIYLHKKFEEIVLYSPMGGGYVSYKFYLPGTKQLDFKTSYIKYFKPLGWIIGAGYYRSYVKEKVKEHVLATLKPFNVFIVDSNTKINQEKYSFIENIPLKKLEDGVLIRHFGKIYYVKYYKNWNWIVGAYVTGSELLQEVYYLKKQFLTRVNAALLVSSVIIVLIVLVASFGLYKANKDLLKAVVSLRKHKRELSRLSRRLKLTAYKDDITGLPNRKKFLEDVINLKMRENLHFALINIRNFRDINDLLGFDDANIILKEFGQELKNIVKSKCKECLVYRIRGDKFGLLGCGFSEVGFVDFVQRVIRNLEAKSFNLKDINLRLDVVAGISENPDNFLIESEMAEEEAKRKGLDLYVFDEELEKKFESLEKNVRIATEIKKALEEDRVVPFFQPIVDLKSSQPVKYEALIRIIDSNGNYLNPGEFLPIAKKISIYRKLSRAVLEKAFKVAADKRLNISVNLSAEDIAYSTMVDWIIASIKHHDIAEKVCFEVVETEAFSDIKTLEKFYFRIKELGSSLAIDDFGSGYSNYEYLATIKPDYIKIDGSLITKVTKSKEIEKLVSHIVMFARDLGIKTVAEFVGSKEIYEKVKELGVDYGQGFYLGKPSPKVPEV